MKRGTVILRACAAQLASPLMEPITVVVLLTVTILSADREALKAFLKPKSEGGAVEWVQRPVYLS
jgi:hypothetical protein